MTEIISFIKYQGLGNDFIIFDGTNHQTTQLLLKGEKKLIKLLCHRQFGIGADGIILALPKNDKADAIMRIFNSDGTEAEMCGNGIRCLVKFLFDKNIVEPLVSSLIDSAINNIKGDNIKIIIKQNTISKNLFNFVRSPF